MHKALVRLLLLFGFYLFLQYVTSSNFFLPRYKNILSSIVLSLLFQACMENSGSIFLKVAVAQQSVEPLPVPVEVSTACVLVCVLVSSFFSYVTFVHFETWFFDLFRQQSRMRSGCMQMLRRLQ